jgi:hypothetical protein
VPEEMRFLLRAGGYGVGIAAIYWFLSQEPAGTVLMAGFGLASLALLAVVWLERRRRGWQLTGRPWRWALLPPADEDTGLTDERAVLPSSSLAPITLALGVALAALGFVFGPWLLAAAVIPLLLGIRGWVIEAGAEYRAMEAADGGSRVRQPGSQAVVKRR